MCDTHTARDREPDNKSYSLFFFYYCGMSIFYECKHWAAKFQSLRKIFILIQINSSISTHTWHFTLGAPPTVSSVFFLFFYTKHIFVFYLLRKPFPLFYLVEYLFMISSDETSNCSITQNFKSKRSEKVCYCVRHHET